MEFLFFFEVGVQRVDVPHPETNDSSIDRALNPYEHLRNCMNYFLKILRWLNNKLLVKPAVLSRDHSPFISMRKFEHILTMLQSQQMLSSHDAYRMQFDQWRI